MEERTLDQLWLVLVVPISDAVDDNGALSREGEIDMP